MKQRLIKSFIVILLVFSTISCAPNEVSKYGNSLTKNNIAKATTERDYKDLLPLDSQSVLIQSEDIDKDGKEEKIVAYFDGSSKAFILDYGENGWTRYNLYLEEFPTKTKTTHLGDSIQPSIFLVDDINIDGQIDIVMDWGTGMHGNITYIFNFDGSRVIELLTADGYYSPPNKPHLEDVNNDTIYEIFSYIGNRNDITGEITGKIYKYTWSKEGKQYISTVEGSYKL